MPRPAYLAGEIDRVAPGLPGYPLPAQTRLRRRLVGSPGGSAPLAAQLRPEAMPPGAGAHAGDARCRREPGAGGDAHAVAPSRVPLRISEPIWNLRTLQSQVYMLSSGFALKGLVQVSSRRPQTRK